MPVLYDFQEESQCGARQATYIEHWATVVGPVNGQGRSHLSTHRQEAFWDLKVKKLQISLAESGKVATFAAYKNKKRMQYPTKRLYLLINVAFFNGSLRRVEK